MEARMSQDDAYEITTETALRALAHPLRLRLVGLLRIDGPATATGLAHRVGESSGSTSYHLRQLAAAGFIEEAPELGKGRERWWRASQRETSWSPARFLHSPSARRADLTVRREILRWQKVVLEQWLIEEPTWGEDWVDSAAESDHLLELTADELRSFKEEYLELATRYGTRADDELPRERVMAFFHAVPVREVLL
jgi:DNA-binding transcriptional ArsR family regulator